MTVELTSEGKFLRSLINIFFFPNLIPNSLLNALYHVIAELDSEPQLAPRWNFFWIFFSQPAHKYNIPRDCRADFWQQVAQLAPKCVFLTTFFSNSLLSVIYHVTVELTSEAQLADKSTFFALQLCLLTRS